jgi:hypothetical protein
VLLLVLLCRALTPQQQQQQQQQVTAMHQRPEMPVSQPQKVTVKTSSPWWEIHSPRQQQQPQDPSAFCPFSLQSNLCRASQAADYERHSSSPLMLTQQQQQQQQKGVTAMVMQMLPTCLQQLLALQQ